MFLKTIQQVKRFFFVVGGFTVLLVGLVLSIPLVPGPGFVFVLVGLAMLAAEFMWARRLLDQLKARGAQLRDAALGTEKNKKPTPAPESRPRDAD